MFSGAGPDKPVKKQPPTGFFAGRRLFFYSFRSLREEYTIPNKIRAAPARNSGVISSCRIRMPSAVEASGWIG